MAGKDEIERLAEQAWEVYRGVRGNNGKSPLVTWALLDASHKSAFTAGVMAAVTAAAGESGPVVSCASLRKLIAEFREPERYNAEAYEVVDALELMCTKAEQLATLAEKGAKLVAQEAGDADG